MILRKSIVLFPDLPRRSRRLRRTDTIKNVFPFVGETTVFCCCCCCWAAGREWAAAEKKSHDVLVLPLQPWLSFLNGALTSSTCRSRITMYVRLSTSLRSPWDVVPFYFIALPIRWPSTRCKQHTHTHTLLQFSVDNFIIIQSGQVRLAMRNK